MNSRQRKSHCYKMMLQVVCSVQSVIPLNSIFAFMHSKGIREW